MSLRLAAAPGLGSVEVEHDIAEVLLGAAHDVAVRGQGSDRGDLGATVSLVARLDAEAGWGVMARSRGTATASRRGWASGHRRHGSG